MNAIMPMTIPVLSIVFLSVSAIAVLAIGFVPLRCEKTGVAAVGEGVAHSVGCLLLLIHMWLIVPWYARVFNDFDSELPRFTTWLLQANDTAVVYWYLLIPFLAFAVVADTVIFRTLHRNERTLTTAQFLSISISVLLAFTIVLSMWAVLVPFFTPIRDLS